MQLANVFKDTGIFSPGRFPSSEIFVMFRPRHEQHYKNWHAMKRGVEAAGGAVVEMDAETIYSRDLYILLGKKAFHPDCGPENSGLRALLEKCGYSIEAIPVRGHKRTAYDGGNCIDDIAGGRAVFGHQVVRSSHRYARIWYQHKQRPCEELTRFASHIGRSAQREPVIVEMTGYHLDCLIGLFPNGQILMKRDETGDEHVRRHQVDIQTSYAYLTGITPEGEKVVRKFYGDKNIMTFSFCDPDTDFTLGRHVLADFRLAEAAAMMTNFEAVGNTIVSNSFSEPLRQRIIREGYRVVEPAAVGEEIFLGGVGGSFLLRFVGHVSASL